MAVRPQRARPTLERKIHFYRAHVGLDGGGRPLTFDPRPALTQIELLPYAEPGRYLTIEEGHVLCCWPRSVSRPQQLVFGTIRRSGLPQVERGGRLSQLQIPPTSGLAESVHVSFFPGNVVGADFNFYGPRLSRLSQYLARRVDGLDVEFEPLLRADVAKQLADLQDVRVMRLRGRASLADSIRRASDSLSDAFAAAARAGEAEDVEIVLRMQPHSRRSLTQRLVGTVRRLAGMDDVRDNASAFVVSGRSRETGRVEEVDILRDQLIVSKQIIRVNDRGRALDPDSAFAAIEEAHRDLRDQLTAAMAVARGQ